ncbi:Alanine--glyoxylate aminotransferase 2-like protein [Monoraphidium neglectum]|uniref:Alanine--glyoxylate aminotransferase 2-like protein n=1 Tax=Monoraphidium neglectum TaxID=145388 RepID=A0A0D2IZE3_9CHLO|nr:Alanine--glyoxylate aminotransferase 2-like protein [Monoraphidium neglectum]KIY93207.1 Alanine--glyoxylate aminotransferase 2-like protein [Monoraphidium neglectum]|eukprot:XP_013892227.1 Alanine--glyoxylate aminotransferase 2-like protein [Monoraphidium neglectum]
MGRDRALYPEVIGDVRGRGLFIGIDIVTDAASKAYAPAMARWLKESAKERFKVLLSTDGPFDQVIKIKPPMVFSEPNADALAAALGALLSEHAASPELCALVAAEEARLYAERTAPLLALYEENAARILALGGGAAATGAGGADGCESPVSTAGATAGSAGAVSSAAAAQLVGKRKSLLRRVLSWASARSSESSASDWEPEGSAAAPASAAAAGKGPAATVAVRA